MSIIEMRIEESVEESHHLLMVSDFAFLFVAFDVLVTVGQVNGSFLLYRFLVQSSEMSILSHSAK